MSKLVEHVSEAIFNVMDITDGLDGEAAKTYARAAIIATLQYARDNATEAMTHAAVDASPLRYFRQTVDRGLGAGYQRCSIDSDDAAGVFRAMLDTLIQEIGGGE